MSRTTTSNPVRIVMPDLNTAPGPIIRATAHRHIATLDPAGPAPEPAGIPWNVPLPLTVNVGIDLSFDLTCLPTPDDPIPLARPAATPSPLPVSDPTPVPTPVPTRRVEPVAGPACAPFRASLPSAQPPSGSSGPRALLPGPSPAPAAAPAGRTGTNVLIFAALCAVVTVTSAFVLRGPLADITKTRCLETQERTAQQHQLAESQALERAIAQDLTTANTALQQLKTSAASLDQQVQAAVGAPLESAIDHPPTAVRRAFLTSAPFKAAWTDLANAAASVADLDALTAIPAAVATRLSQHDVTESDRQQLRQLLTAIRSQQAEIDSVDLSFLQGHEVLDSRYVAQTMQHNERR